METVRRKTLFWDVYQKNVVKADHEEGGQEDVSDQIGLEINEAARLTQHR